MLLWPVPALAAFVLGFPATVASARTSIPAVGQAEALPASTGGHFAFLGEDESVEPALSLNTVWPGTWPTAPAPNARHAAAAEHVGVAGTVPAGFVAQPSSPGYQLGNVDELAVWAERFLVHHAVAELVVPAALVFPDVPAVAVSSCRQLFLRFEATLVQHLAVAVVRHELVWRHLRPRGDELHHDSPVVDKASQSESRAAF